MRQIKTTLFLQEGVIPINDIVAGVTKANFDNKEHFFDPTGFQFPATTGQKDIYLFVNTRPETTHEGMSGILEKEGLMFCENAENYLFNLPFGNVKKIVQKFNSREITAAGEKSVMYRASDNQNFLVFVETIGGKFIIRLKSVSFKEEKFPKLKYRDREIILAQKIQ